MLLGMRSVAALSRSERLDYWYYCVAVFKGFLLCSLPSARGHFCRAGKRMRTRHYHNACLRAALQQHRLNMTDGARRV